MLSAFTARPVVELKQRDKSKIESVLAYGKSACVYGDVHSFHINRLIFLPKAIVFSLA